MGNKQSKTPQQSDVSALQHNHLRLRNAGKIVKKDANLIQAYFPVGSQKEYQSWKDSLERDPCLNSSNAMLPLETDIKKEGMCGKSYLAKGVYPEYWYLLSDEIKNFKKLNNEIGEGQLWLLASGLGQVGRDYHACNMKVGDIRPANVILNEDGKPKVVTQHSWPEEQTNYQKTLTVNQKTYLSPEQNEQCGIGRIQPNSDIEKSEAFSIGLTLLDSALLEDSYGMYRKRGDFDQWKLRDKQHKLLSHPSYSDLVKATIINLTSMNPQQRITPTELANMLEPNKVQIQNYHPFTAHSLPGKLQNTLRENGLQILKRQNRPPSKLQSQLQSSYQPGKLQSSYHPTHLESSHQRLPMESSSSRKRESSPMIGSTHPIKLQSTPPPKLQSTPPPKLQSMPPSKLQSMPPREPSPGKRQSELPNENIYIRPSIYTPPPGGCIDLRGINEIKQAPKLESSPSFGYPSRIPSQMPITHITPPSSGNQRNYIPSNQPIYTPSRFTTHDTNIHSTPYTHEKRYQPSVIPSSIPSTIPQYTPHYPPRPSHFEMHRPSMRDIYTSPNIINRNTERIYENRYSEEKIQPPVKYQINRRQNNYQNDFRPYNQKQDVIGDVNFKPLPNPQIKRIVTSEPSNKKTIEKQTPKYDVESDFSRADEGQYKMDFLPTQPKISIKESMGQKRVHHQKQLIDDRYERDPEDDENSPKIVRGENKGFRNRHYQQIDNDSPHHTKKIHSKKKIHRPHQNVDVNKIKQSMKKHIAQTIQHPK